MSMTQVGIADFVTTIVGAAAAYAGGAASDRYGRKRILVAGLMLQVVSYLFISLAINARVAIPLFVLTLAVNQFCGSIYKTVPDVMVADVVEPDSRVEAYGLLRIGSNVGWVIGPIMGGALLMFTSYANLFYVTAMTTFAYLLIAVFILRDTRPKATPERLKLKDVMVVAADTPFLAFCGLMLFMTIPYQQMYTLLSVYSSAYVGLSEFWIGTLFALSGLMVVLLQYHISTRVSRHRMTAALAFSALVFAIGFGTLSLSTAFIVPFVAMAINTFAEMVWSPAGSTLQANMSPEGMRGRYFGFSGLTSSVGWAIGPLFGGILKDSMGGSVPYMWAIVGAMFLFSMAGFLLLGRLIPSKANYPPAREKALEKNLKA
jgi:MFS family permease